MKISIIYIGMFTMFHAIYTKYFNKNNWIIQPYFTALYVRISDVTNLNWKHGMLKKIWDLSE